MANIMGVVIRMRYNRRHGHSVPEGVRAHHKGRKRHLLDDVVPLDQLRREVKALGFE